MTTLDPARLKKLVLLLSSDQPGEVTAAAGAIGRLLQGVNLSWHDLADRLAGADRSAKAKHRPPPPEDEEPPETGWREQAKRLRGWFGLTRWERDFLESILASRRPHLTAKQQERLQTILRRAGLYR